VGIAGPAGGVLVLVPLFIVFALTVPDGAFLQTGNLLGILQESAPLALVAVAMTLCLVAGEVDLSVAGIIGLSGVVVARAVDAGLPWPVSVLLAILSGTAVGLVNGLATARVGTLVRLFPSFLVTLATGMVAIGIARGLSPGDVAVPIADEGFISAFGFDDTLAGNKPLLYAAAAIAIAYLILHRSAFGYRLFLVGANSSSASLAGVNVLRTKFGVMVISGTFAGFAGVITAGYLSSGSYDMGHSGAELNAIAAAVLGGTALFGGKGNVFGTLIGVLVLGVLGQGVLLLQLPTQLQLVLTGAVILVAIAFGEFMRRANSSRA
jgi:ribose transport system permease protein